MNKLPPTFVVEIPGLRTRSELNVRVHWRDRDRRRRSQQGMVQQAFRAAGVRWQGVPYRVHLTRIGPRAMDSDNACISLKHTRDAVAELLGFNDRIDIWTYGQEKGPYGVRIEVWT